MIKLVQLVGMDGIDMPPPARGCLSAAKAGVDEIHTYQRRIITDSLQIYPMVADLTPSKDLLMKQSEVA